MAKLNGKSQGESSAHCLNADDDDDAAAETIRITPTEVTWHHRCGNMIS